MNIIEKQIEMNRALFEINQNTMQELARAQQESVKQYFDMTTTFGQRLPEVKDVSSFVELQREYGETLWNGVKATTSSQAEILRTAVEETGEAVRKAFTVETAA